MLGHGRPELHVRNAEMEKPFLARTKKGHHKIKVSYLLNRELDIASFF